PSNCLPGHWRISRGAVDGRRTIFSRALPQRSRDIQRQANPGEPSALRISWAYFADAGLRIHRNALQFRRPIVDAGIDLQAYMLRPLLPASVMLALRCASRRHHADLRPVEAGQMHATEAVDPFPL